MHKKFDIRSKANREELPSYTPSSDEDSPKKK